MAQIGINVSSKHGSTIDVSRMLSDECLGFETTVFLHAKNVKDPHFYCRDTVTIHGDRMAIRALLEKCLSALNARTAEVEA